MQGPIYVFYDAYADVLYVTVGKRRSAYHIHLGNGIALRFDTDTGKCVGFVVIASMQYDEAIALPLWVVLTHAKDNGRIE
jgi:hypothetical protein